jgi:hypothetical protein
MTETYEDEAPAERDGCARGLLAVGLGLVLGFCAQQAALAVLAHAWTTCTGWPWPPTSDMVDSPRFGLFEWIGYGLLYSARLPLGVALGARLLRGRRRAARLLLGLALAATLLGGLACVDVALHVDIESVADLSRCPNGVPPWWPWS